MILKNSFKLLLLAGVLLAFSACKKDSPDPIAPPVIPPPQDTIPPPPPSPVTMPTACQEAQNTPGPEGPGLVFKFWFNDTQVRLNNFGLPATMPSNHAGQSPDFNSISAHYIELAPSAFTALGTGDVLYVGTETTAGGATALDFNQAIFKSECEDFIRIPFSQITPGTYEWLRVSLAYQNYDIQYRFGGTDYSGTVASFIGFNTYITSYPINTASLTVNDNRLQGYWGFETTVFGITQTSSGQAPEGATTVPNPLFNSAPIPAGSCVVTGPFSNNITITGNETEDLVIVISLSTNHSFEWIDVIADGKYEPLSPTFQATGEIPVDMGVRGMQAIVVE
jgi:hypothetical protein